MSFVRPNGGNGGRYIWGLTKSGKAANHVPYIHACRIGYVYGLLSNNYIDKLLFVWTIT